MRALSGAPQPDVVIVRLFAPLEEGVIAEIEVAGLKPGFPCRRLAGDDRRRGDVEHDLVDIGKLASQHIDPVEIGVAGKHEAL